MERPLPRQRSAASGAAIPAQRRRFAARLLGSGDMFDQSPTGANPGPASITSPAHDGFTLAGPRLLRRIATTRRMARTTRTAMARIIPPITAPKARPRIRQSCTCARRVKRAMLATRVPLARHADAAGAATNSAARSKATTTPIARTTRSPGWTGRAPARCRNRRMPQKLLFDFTSR